MKVATAEQKVNELRAAIRAEGSERVCDAWSRCEGLVDLMLSRWRGDFEPDWEGFAKIILAYYPDLTVEPSDLHDLAVQYGLMREVEYNPDEHGPNEYGAEPGDPWVELTYKARA